MTPADKPLDNQALLQILVELMSHYAASGNVCPLGRDDLVNTIAVADRWVAASHYSFAHTLPFEADKRLSAADKLLLLATVALTRMEKVRE